MEKTCESAELVGIILGDGNIYVNRKRGIYALRITLGLDEAEYSHYAARLVRSCLGVTPRITVYRNNGKPVELVVLVYSRAVIRSLLAAGLKAGNKVVNNVRIPAWIRNEPNFLRSCLRGLIDTDGCIYKKYRYPSPQLEFYSQSPALLADVQSGFRRLGFGISAITAGKRTTPKCGLYKKEELARYCREVGFVNLKNVIRLNNISALVV